MSTNVHVQMLEGKLTDDSLDGLRKKLEKLNADWMLLEKLADERGERLKNAFIDAKSFDTQIHEFLDWLPTIESRLRTKVCL